MGAALKMLPPELIDASVAEITRELWRKGDLSWLYHAGQTVIEEAFRQTQGQSVAIEVSRQMGKTTWAVAKACETAIQNPYSSSRIGTAFYGDLRAILLPAFRFVLTTCPEDLRPKFLESKGLFVFPNGSEILLVGLDRNPEKLRGARLRLIVIDEAGSCSSEKLRYTHISVIVPATTHEPNAKVVFLSTTPPEGAAHYFCQVADKAKLHGGHVKLTIHDNPLLTRDRVREIATEMGGEDSVEFRREYLCERIIDAKRALIPEFSEQRHVQVAERPAYFRFLHTYESLDTGVRHLTACLFGYYDFPKAKLVIENEFTLHGHEVTTKNIRRRVIETEKALGYESLYRRPADNDNLILLQDLAGDEFDEQGNRLPGISFYPTGKDSLEAMVNAVRLLFADDRILIHPRCKMLIGTLSSGLWNEKRDDYEEHELYGHADCLAALVYLVRNLDRHTNPIPTWFDVSQSETISFFPNDGLTDTARALRGLMGGT